MTLDSLTDQGTFSRNTLPNLLRTLAHQTAVGRLFLESEARQAVLGFNQGVLVDAILAEHVGEAALLLVLRFEHGAYSFRTSHSPLRVSIRRPLETLLSELSKPAATPQLQPQVRSGVSRMTDAVFFAELGQRLASMVGPIAPMLIQDVSAQMAVSSQTLPAERLEEFLLLLEMEVPERKRREFQQMAQVLKGKFAS